MSVIPADPERLGQLLRELEDLNIAEKIIGGQIQNEEQQAGKKLIDSQKEEIKRRGNRWAKAYVDVHPAHLDYEELIDALEDAGASVGHLRIRPNGVSHTHDRSGNYFYAIQEFIEAGFLSKGDMPKVLN